MLSPLTDTLERLHDRFAGLTDGAVATYIPQLGKADPAHFAICVTTVDGARYAIGDAEAPFTIQSISKPFVYGLALDDNGSAAVRQKVGVEPSGEAFNAISLEPDTGRPRNPMINAGAIATASLVNGADGAERTERTVEALSRFAGRTLSIDGGVYASERDTGHRNRAISYLLRNAGIVGEDVDEVLDRYFMQCSVLVTCSDLSVMAATLANAGRHPHTQEQVIRHEHVENVLSVMSTCGMYDYAGSWLYDVGMPAKSGVAGGVIAVLPGQLGIAAYSPPLDPFGNSVRGVAVCRALSREFGLHLLRPPVQPASVLMTQYTLADVSSKRRRSAAEMDALVRGGGAVRVFRLQGPLVFSTAEVTLRRALAEIQDQHAATIVFDCQRVSSIDGATRRLFGQFARGLVDAGGTIAFAGINEGDIPLELPDGGAAASEAILLFRTIDAALEWFEDRIIERAVVEPLSTGELALETHPMFASLSGGELEELSGLLERAEFARGDRIVEQGDESDAMFFVVSGDVSVRLRLGDTDHHLLAVLGPGTAFGEVALMDRSPRTADIYAETDVACYALPTSAFDALGGRAPAIRMKLLEQLARDLSARLRRADLEIAALAS